jgi:hypothetical protein
MRYYDTGDTMAQEILWHRRYYDTGDTMIQ